MMSWQFLCYILHGKLITHQTVTHVALSGTETTDQLHFFYDKDSRPAMVEHTDNAGVKALYHYRHNLQGDIIEILDSTGAKVVEYRYDAWGELLDPFAGSGTTQNTNTTHGANP